ncbi:MAG TPA: hypothetical protein EYP59_07575 [Thiotrichaceae bacterium]|nr:hypothetical protein [Thiotrichaceae bacterium]
MIKKSRQAENTLLDEQNRNGPIITFAQRGLFRIVDSKYEMWVGLFNKGLFLNERENRRQAEFLGKVGVRCRCWINDLLPISPKNQLFKY